MALIGVTGRNVDQQLVLFALDNGSALLVDCSNCANPHQFSQLVPDERFHDVFVVEAESLYRFRSVVMALPRMARSLGVRRIVVTSFSRLFDFDDEAENADVFEHCWGMIREVAYRYDVFIGVSEAQMAFAKRFCDRWGGLDGPYGLESEGGFGSDGFRAARLRKVAPGRGAHCF
ncbi:hypothetical protein HYY74_04855 [Candidatus Woesearchaeota archaeon]|nr:hypothetical protein [Candidatus Woesearchaeota archaeon]